MWDVVTRDGGQTLGLLTCFGGCECWLTRDGRPVVCVGAHSGDVIEMLKMSEASSSTRTRRRYC